MPTINEEDARRVTSAVLAMRGVNQRMQKQSHQDGHLKLHRRPLAYKGLSRAWLRNYSMAKEADDWTKAPKHEEDRGERVIPLNQVRCPACNYSHETANNKMRTKVGFGNLTCKRCRQVTKASCWHCDCGIDWHKCAMHVHKDLMRSVSLSVGEFKRGFDFSTKGSSDSLPKRARTEWSEAAISDSSQPVNRISIDQRLYPRLATKFPDFILQDQGLR